MGDRAAGEESGVGGRGRVGARHSFFVWHGPVTVISVHPLHDLGNETGQADGAQRLGGVGEGLLQRRLQCGHLLGEDLHLPRQHLHRLARDAELVAHRLRGDELVSRQAVPARAEQRAPRRTARRPPAVRVQAATSAWEQAAEKVHILDTEPFFVRADGSIRAFDSDGRALYYDQKHLSHLGVSEVKGAVRALFLK